MPPRTLRRAWYVVALVLCLGATRSALLSPPGAGTARAPFAQTSAPGAKRGAPNILVVLIDDGGYGQTATFGGLVPTPTLDALAARGLRFTRFHVTALCSPTRAALLTGRNNHAVGMGTITNLSTGAPGYTGSIPRSAAMLPEVLRDRGYSTASIGKWHLIPDPEMTPAGPFDHWPTRQGFDYFYGFLGGETDQWHPELVEGTTPVSMTPPPGREDDYTLTEDLAGRARAWILQQKALAPDRPVFMYFAPGAVHAPLQAPKRWVEPFRGRFDIGWDEYRKIVFQRQKALGVIPATAELTPRPAGIPAWDSLRPSEKKVAARLMEVFAGFMAQADHEVGRVLDAFRQAGQIDNTLVIVIAGDNGASLEGGLFGTDNIMEQVNGVQLPPDALLPHLDDLGGPSSNPHYPVGWAWAGNTPFQWGKRFGSHLGGTRDPMVIAWPGRIPSPGGTRDQYTHVTDLFPTILEAAGIEPPRVVNGVEQQPVDGVSFLEALARPSAPERRTRQYFEMHGNKSIYSGGWLAAQRSGLLPWSGSDVVAVQPAWELYDLTRDYSEAHDVAAAHPEKLAQLQQEFDAEAARNHVFPIDPRFAARAHESPPPPGGRAFYTFYPGATHVFAAMAPPTRNRTHTITAYVDLPPGGADGVLVADGGLSAGYALYIKDGRPGYTYNYFRREVTTVVASDPLPAGKAVVEVQFVYDGGGEGRGATVTLRVNGTRSGEARLGRTVPRMYSYDETFDVGEDSASPVGPYVSPFRFAGSIEKVEVRIENASKR
jgi:arylsulfatase A-like enzyme